MGQRATTIAENMEFKQYLTTILLHPKQRWLLTRQYNTQRVSRRRHQDHQRDLHLVLIPRLHDYLALLVNLRVGHLSYRATFLAPNLVDQ